MIQHFFLNNTFIASNTRDGTNPTSYHILCPRCGEVWFKTITEVDSKAMYPGTHHAITNPCAKCYTPRDILLQPAIHLIAKLYRFTPIPEEILLSDFKLLKEKING